MTEQEAVLTIAFMAALADGGRDEAERAALQRVSSGFAGSGIDAEAIFEAVLLRKRSLPEAAAALTSPEARRLAYETAVAVCDADGTSSALEQQFLAALRSELRLPEADTKRVFDQAEAIAAAPVAAAGSAAGKIDEAELDKTILNYAILNGALELMPASLATMGIVALQMKMVYRVGKQYGYELDQGHVKDFLSVAGVGLTSQYLEGFARKLIGGVLGTLGGGMIGGLGRQATSSAMSFAVTYALGQAAKQYYAGGRTLAAVDLKGLYAKFLEQGKALRERYAGDIQQKAGSIDASRLVSLIKES